MNKYSVYVCYIYSAGTKAKKEINLNRQFFHSSAYYIFFYSFFFVAGVLCMHLLIMAMKLYRKIFDKYPYRVQIMTVGTVMGSADIISQTVTKKKTEKYDGKRICVMSLMGFCYIGPVYSLWYRVLHKAKLSPIKCLALDQSLTGPLVNAGFCFLHPLLSGKSTNEATEHFKTKSLSVIKSAWKIFIPAQTVNYFFIPYHFKVLYTVNVSLLWYTYLSCVLNGCDKSSHVSFNNEHPTVLT